MTYTENKLEILPTSQIIFPTSPILSNLGYHIDLLKEMTRPNYLRESFDNRLTFGKFGEKVFQLALKMQLIKNGGFEELGQQLTKQNKMKMLKKEWEALVEENAIHGDVRFINLLTGLYEYVDVKTTDFIAVDSLDRFRRDGWYMLNTITISNKFFYFLVRNNDAFRNAVMQKAVPSIYDAEVYGYNVDFNNHLNQANHPGLEFMFMDPEIYRWQLIKPLRLELYDLGINNLLPNY